MTHPMRVAFVHPDLGLGGEHSNPGALRLRASGEPTQRLVLQVQSAWWWMLQLS